MSGVARALFVVVLVWGSLATGCTLPATQLLVVVDSDYGPAELRSIEVRTYEASAFRAEFPSAVPIEMRTLQVRPGSPAAVSMPFSFGVVPLDSDAQRRVVVELTAYPESGAEPVVVRVITGFVLHEIRRVPMFISRNCEGVICGADESCDESGECVPAAVSPGPPVVPGQEFEDAARGDAGRDGGVAMDASMDAPMTDAYREDVYVPPGVDADMDAALDPDAFLDLDAFVVPDAYLLPDAYVPPGVDASFPDAWAPDAWAPDAFAAPDAYFVPDARLPDAFTPSDARSSADALDAPDALDLPDAYDAPDAYYEEPDAYYEEPDSSWLEMQDATTVVERSCDSGCGPMDCTCGPDDGFGMCLQSCTGFICSGSRCLPFVPGDTWIPCGSC